MVKNGNACHLFFRVPEIGTEVPRVTIFRGQSTGNYRLTVLFWSGRRRLNSLFLSLKSHVYADFGLVVNTTTNPSPTTILNFRRPLDGFLLLLSVKVPVSNLGLTPTKWWWDFSWYTFGTQMVHKILCRQRCKNGKGLPSRPERNFLFQDEGPGSFQETARYIRNPACSQRFQLEYCCSKE